MILEAYAKNVPNMTADIPNDDNYKIDTSPMSCIPLQKCDCTDINEDFTLLAQEVLNHKCSDYYLNASSKNKKKRRLCRSGFGCKAHPGKCDTSGQPLKDIAAIIIDHRKIEHFQMRRSYSTRVCQTSKTLLLRWQANCDIQLILYHSDLRNPNMSKIQIVSKYVTSYTVKNICLQNKKRNIFMISY